MLVYILIVLLSVILIAAIFILSYLKKNSIDSIQKKNNIPATNQYERVNIEEFIQKYIKGASIPEPLFIELQKKLLHGETYADIPNYLIAQVKQNLERHQKAEKALFDCANLNNIGIEQERNGDIDGAIATYEKNISSSYAATHPYERLMILYRKRKEYDKEIFVIEKAINVFSNENWKRAKEATKQCPSKSEEIYSALKSCTMVYDVKISTFTGKPMVCFNPYDINKYRKRLEKAKLLKEKVNK